MLHFNSPEPSEYMEIIALHMYLEHGLEIPLLEPYDGEQIKIINLPKGLMH
jgi:hypothetical protein